MILNLGCGGVSRIHNRLSARNIINFDVQRNESWLDIQGDAHCLPFPDNAFNSSMAYHVLEHCYRPLLVLQELSRVTQHLVVIKVPNAENYKFIKEPNGHIYSWNKKTLGNLLRIVFPVVHQEKTFNIRKKTYPERLANWALICINRKETELTAICQKR